MNNAPWIPLPVSVLSFEKAERDVALYFYSMAFSRRFSPFFVSARVVRAQIGAKRTAYDRAVSQLEYLGLADFKTTKSGTKVTIFRNAAKPISHTDDTQTTQRGDTQTAQAFSTQTTQEFSTQTAHRRHSTVEVQPKDTRNADTQTTHRQHSDLAHRQHSAVTHKQHSDLAHRRHTDDTVYIERESVCEGAGAPARAPTRVYVEPEQEQPKPALMAPDYKKVGAVYAGIMKRHCGRQRCKIPKPEGKDGAKLSRYLEWHGAETLILALRYFENSADCEDLREQVDRPNKILATGRFRELMHRYKRSRFKSRREPAQEPAQPKRSVAPKRLADLKSVGEQIVAIQRGALVMGLAQRQAVHGLPHGLTRGEVEGVGGDYDVFRPLRASLLQALKEGGSTDAWSWLYARAAGGGA